MDAKQTALLSIPEFANALGVKRSCIRRWVLMRKITIFKVGRLVRVPSTELDRLLAEGLRPARRER
jgi:excisionase family DNA binding protein